MSGPSRTPARFGGSDLVSPGNRLRPTGQGGAQFPGRASSWEPDYGDGDFPGTLFPQPTVAASVQAFADANVSAPPFLRQ